MRLLLDSHVLLWWLAGQPGLGPSTQRTITAEADVFVSAATVWELGIKQAKGRLRLPEDAVTAIDAEGFSPLPITFSHAAAAGDLPPHHRDPFGRMLVAQAQVEGLTIVTADARIAAYQVAILAATD